MPIMTHINDVTTNPHNVNKEDVGLGNVQNYPMATEAQALALNSTQHYLSPLTGHAAALQALKNLGVLDANGDPVV